MMFRFRLFFFLVLVFNSPVWAQQGQVRPDGAQQLEEEIGQLKIMHQLRDKQLVQEIEHLHLANEALEAVVNQLLQRIEALESATAKHSKIVAAEEESTEVSLSAEEQNKLQNEAEENYQLVQKAFEQRLVKEGGMLLAPYEFIYEPSFSYGHSSYDNIVVDGFTIFPILVVGDIVSERVRRDIVTNQHAFRLGLPWDTQIDLAVPLGYERERSSREDGTNTSKNTSGLGDISLSLSYQLIKSNDFWPDTVVGLSWKPTTGDDPYRITTADNLALGSGFETWGASITSMTMTDPAVLFGGFSTSYSRGDEKTIGYVQPGESYGLSLGIALALNFDTSISFNYQYRYNREIEIEHKKIDGSDLTTSIFSIGMSKALSDFYAVDIDLGMGLTQDSTDFQFTVSFPFRFSLRDNK
ncbi:MAG: hypothetical protein QNK24_11935 [Desulfuromusa sp.]|nr:hypothetical protein [Desulfuromusa sp.]